MISSKKKICLVILLITAAIVAAFPLCVFFRIREYRTLDMIRLTAIVRERYSSDIPVEYVPGKTGEYSRTFPVTDQSRKNYFLHWNPETDELLFTICRWEFGGFVVLHGFYRIKDAHAKGHLLTFLKAHNWE